MSHLWFLTKSCFLCCPVLPGRDWATPGIGSQERVWPVKAWPRRQAAWSSFQMESSMGKGCGDPILMDGSVKALPALTLYQLLFHGKLWRTYSEWLRKQVSFLLGERLSCHEYRKQRHFFLSSTDTCTTPAGTWTLWQPSEKTPALLLACINKSYDSQVPHGNWDSQTLSR